MDYRLTILIFGTFNPVTNAHVNMGVRAINAHPEASIVYVPTHQDFLTTYKGYKESDILQARVRLSLLRNAIEPYSFGVFEGEIRSRIPSKTYDTVSMLSYRYPLMLCIGADNLVGLHKWYRADKLVRRNKFIVVTRNGDRGSLHQSLQKYADHFEYIEGDYQEVSSTKVREAVRNGDWQSVEEMVPRNVYNYLRNKGE